MSFATRVRPSLPLDEGRLELSDGGCQDAFAGEERLFAEACRSPILRP